MRLPKIVPGTEPTWELTLAAKLTPEFPQNASGAPGERRWGLGVVVKVPAETVGWPRTHRGSSEEQARRVGLWGPGGPAGSAPHGPGVRGRPAAGGLEEEA